MPHVPGHQTRGTPHLNVPLPKNLPRELSDYLETLRRQTEFWLVRVTEGIDKQRGIRGTPELLADVDLRGHRLTNIGAPLAGSDAVRSDMALTRATPEATFYDAGDRGIRSSRRGERPTDVVIVAQLEEQSRREAQSMGSLRPQNPPPDLAEASTVGAVVQRYAGEDHAHGVTSGTFQITATGFATPPTGMAMYVLLGKAALLFVPALTGTSNATTMTLTGLDAAIVPAAAAFVPCLATDTGTVLWRTARVNAASAVIDLFATPPTGAWTASGTKAVAAQWLVYGLT